MLKLRTLTDFQVFYGENEAGKSTIMAFIHGILFGFPTKQQSRNFVMSQNIVQNMAGKLEFS